MTANRVEVSREIAAPPAAVFAAITDVTRMGEWSPETRRCEWNDGFSAAAVGASFTGHNRNGDLEWSIEAKITAYLPDCTFVFDAMYRDFAFATWGYEIEPTNEGCCVTESWIDRRPQEFIDAGEGISGVADRASHNEAGMKATLRALAAAVE